MIEYGIFSCPRPTAIRLPRFTKFLNVRCVCVCFSAEDYGDIDDASLEQLSNRAPAYDDEGIEADKRQLRALFGLRRNMPIQRRQTWLKFDR